MMLARTSIRWSTILKHVAVPYVSWGCTYQDEKYQGRMLNCGFCKGQSWRRKTKMGSFLLPFIMVQLGIGWNFSSVPKSSAFFISSEGRVAVRSSTATLGSLEEADSFPSSGCWLISFPGRPAHPPCFSRAGWVSLIGWDASSTASAAHSLSLPTSQFPIYFSPLKNFGYHFFSRTRFSILGCLSS